MRARLVVCVARSCGVEARAPSPPWRVSLVVSPRTLLLPLSSAAPSVLISLLFAEYSFPCISRNRDCSRSDAYPFFR